MNKNLGIVTVFSTTLLVSGCVSTPPVVDDLFGETVHDFIGTKTNLKLSDKIQVCSAASGNRETCRPTKTGGLGKWARNTQFDVYGLRNTATFDDYEAAKNELRSRYLGTPYYNSSLHFSCKSKIDPSAIAPNDTVLIDTIDLTAELKARAVEETTANLVAALKAEKVDVSAEIEANFRNKLTEAVESKTNVKYIWFFMKWTGGYEAIKNSDSFKMCAQTVDEKNKKIANSASLVTGVAGLIVLNNQIDTTVNSESIVTAAINAAVPAKYNTEIAKISAQVSAGWKKSITSTYTAKGALNSKTQIVYPVWVQFERG